MSGAVVAEPIVEKIDRAALAAQPVFDCLVMQGGGIRCFWQAGFLSRLTQEMPLRPQNIYSVSAAAGIACAFVADRLDFSVECFKAAAHKNPKNFYPANLFSSKPLFPHAGIYRRLLLEVFEGEGLEKLSKGSEVHVLLTRPPEKCPALAVVPFGAMLLAVRLNASRATWKRVRRWSGFSGEYVSTRHCITASDVADLVLASSCTPPMTPLYRFNGRPSLDGGLLESVPRSALRGHHGRALIMMTNAPGRMLPSRVGDVVVHPSQPITASPWDYTNPAAVDAVVALGRQDAEQFLRSCESRSYRTNIFS